MILTVILAIAVIWLGVLTIGGHFHDKAARDENLPRLITVCSLLALWIYTTV